MTDTVRLGILRHIKTLYEAATDQETPPSGQKYYGVRFSKVEIGPLGDVDQTKRFTVGIVAGEERKSDLFPLKTSMFDVSIEFRMTINKGDAAPGIAAEELLGQVQQVIYDDPTLGGRVLKADETANEIDLVMYTDRTVTGMVKFTIHYRHRHDNVYDPNPSV